MQNSKEFTNAVTTLIDTPVSESTIKKGPTSIWIGMSETGSVAYCSYTDPEPEPKNIKIVYKCTQHLGANVQIAVWSFIHTTLNELGVEQDPDLILKWIMQFIANYIVQVETVYQNSHLSYDQRDQFYSNTLGILTNGMDKFNVESAFHNDISNRRSIWEAAQKNINA